MNWLLGRRPHGEKIKSLILLAVLMTGCATNYNNDPLSRPMANEVVRAEVKACKAAGMVPELVTVNNRTVWVQCWLPKLEPAP